MGSACELGRAADLHRSTVLRFCESGRATSRTAQKLQVGLTALSVGYDGSHSIGQPPSETSAALTASLEIPQDLRTLRSLLQALIGLIDTQIATVPHCKGVGSMNIDPACPTSTGNTTIGG